MEAECVSMGKFQKTAEFRFAEPPKGPEPPMTGANTPGSLAAGNPFQGPFKESCSLQKISQTGDSEFAKGM